MSSLVLGVGIAVTFLVVWGLVMTGAYFLGRDEVVEGPTLLVSNSTAQVRPGDPRRTALPEQPR